MEAQKFSPGVKEDDISTNLSFAFDSLDYV